MSYKMVDCKCENCGHTTEYLKHRDEMIPYLCPKCESWSMLEIPSAPAIRTSDSASYRDGYKRKGFQDMKEAARLEVLKANVDSAEERAGIQKEIDRLRKI